MQNTKNNHGIVLFAHGSRDPLWRAPMEAVRQHIEAQSAAAAVRCAYLELCAPSLPDAVQELLAESASHNGSSGMARSNSIRRRIIQSVAPPR